VRGVKELTEKTFSALAQIAPQRNLSVGERGRGVRAIRANPWIRTDRHRPGISGTGLVIECGERTAPVALVNTGRNLFLMDATDSSSKKLSRSDDVVLAIMTGVNIQAGRSRPCSGGPQTHAPDAGRRTARRAGER
jgi:hypothetical protein